jgi:hypothetical protein
MTLSSGKKQNLQNLNYPPQMSDCHNFRIIGWWIKGIFLYTPFAYTWLCRLQFHHPATFPKENVLLLYSYPQGKGFASSSGTGLS